MSNLSDYIGAGASGLLASATTLTDVTGTQTLDFSNNGAYIVTQGAGALTLNISSETDARNEGVLILTRNPDFSITFGANVFDVVNVIETLNFIGPQSSIDISASSSNDLYGLQFNSDGTKLIVIARSSGTLYQYSLSTAYDVTTATYDSVSVTIGTNRASFKFADSGNSFLTIDTDDDTVYQNNLSVPYDITSTSTVSTFAAGGIENTVNSSYMSADGTKLFVLGVQNRGITQYTLSTAYDVSTASYDNVVLKTDSAGTNTFDMAFSNDGLYLFVLIVGTPDKIIYFKLSSAFDITSAVLTKIFEITEGSFGITPIALSLTSGLTELVFSDLSGTLYTFDIESASKSTVQVHGNYKSIIANYTV